MTVLYIHCSALSDKMGNTIVQSIRVPCGTEVDKNKMQIHIKNFVFWIRTYLKTRHEERMIITINSSKD
jgi:hypothetical protein